jgi:hypothetical protein
MIFVIVPLGKEARDIAHWVIRVVMYTAASTVGAALLAMVLGMVGAGLHAMLPAIGYQWATALLGLSALVYALHELNIIHLPAPQVGWQVPKSWQRSSRLLGNTLYGFVLGMGIFTFIPFASFYLLLMWEVTAGAVDLRAAAMLGAIYGAFRGLPAVLGGISMLRGVYPLPVSNWLLAHLGWWHAINGLALLLVGGFLLGSFVV